MPSFLVIKDSSHASEKPSGRDLGALISAKVFGVEDDGSLDWTGFLQGFDSCVKQSLGANRLKLLLSLLTRSAENIQTADRESLSSDDAKPPATEGCGEGNTLGSVSIDQFREFLTSCWLMTSFASFQPLMKSSSNQEQVQTDLPDLEPLCRAAQQALAAGTADGVVFIPPARY